MILQGAPVAAQPFDVKDLEFEKGETVIGLLTGWLRGRSRGGDPVPRYGGEIEAGRGITDYWLLTVHAHVDDESQLGLRGNHVTVESLFKLHPPREQGLNLGWYAGLEVGTQFDQTNRFISGPILSLKAGKTTFNANPLLDKSFGRNREDGISLAYAWNLKQEVAKGVEIGVTGFGRIDELGGSLPASQQEHRIGPAIFIEREVGKDRHVHFALGLLFGLTDAVPDAAIKANAFYSFK